MIKLIGITTAQINLPLYKCPNPGVIIDKRNERNELLFFILKLFVSVSIFMRYNGIAAKQQPRTNGFGDLE
jgi:hypothetical protein